MGNKQSWLSVVGADLKKALPIIFGITRAAAAFLPGGSVVATVIADLNMIPGLIVTGESMFPAIAGATTGSQKLAAVTPMVQQLIIQYANDKLPGANKILDPQKLANASAQITSGFADALSSFGA